MIEKATRINQAVVCLTVQLDTYKNNLQKAVDEAYEGAASMYQKKIKDLEHAIKMLELVDKVDNVANAETALNEALKPIHNNMGTIEPIRAESDKTKGGDRLGFIRGCIIKYNETPVSRQKIIDYIMEILQG